MGRTKPADPEIATEESVETSQEQASRPAARFSGTGGLNVAVWKHKSEQGMDRYSIRIDRSYKDDAGYKTTSYLRDGDLLRVQKLLSQADDWIEQEKIKHRSAPSQELRQVR